MRTANQPPAEPEPMNGIRRPGTAPPSPLRRERVWPGLHSGPQQRDGDRPAGRGVLRGSAR